MRTRGLKRLAKLYGMVEDLHAMQVKGAAAAVFEVERAAAELAGGKAQGASEAREGLARGSRLESLSMERSALQDEARAALLARVEAERRTLLEAALVAHRESRIKSQQIDGLVERVKQTEDRERERLAQAESDDRFLSRREWLRGRTL